MAANGGGRGPVEWEDDELAMVVSARGLVAWVPAQALAENGGRDALPAALRQNAWVPAEAAARTGWRCPPGMIVVEDLRALAVARRYRWIRHSDALEHGWLRRTTEETVAATTALCLACLYLPAQEVARSRAVSKMWRRLTSTDEFRRRHRCRSTPMPLFLFHDPRPRLPAYNLRAVDTRGRVSRPVLRFNRDRRNKVVGIHGSCAGILLLSVDFRLYACNPCTRRWAHLPTLHIHRVIIGFYATTTGPAGFRCKVLYQDREGNSYWIFTLGSPAPRGIGRPGPVDLDVFLLAGGVAYAYKLPPVLFRGFLHWVPRPEHNNRNILRFDTLAETFSMIPGPTFPGDDVGDEDIPSVGYQLFEIDQHLAMTVEFHELAMLHVWIRSNIDQVWRPGYIIHLPEDVIDKNIFRFFAVAQDRNVMVCCNRVLLQCDDRETVRQRYRLARNFTILTGHTIEESLLLHPLILPMQDPPFLRNQ